MTAEREPLFTAAYLRVWTVNFVAFLAALQLFPTIPFRVLDLGGTKSQAGLFLAFYTFASACSAPLMGAVADAIGRRRQALISAVMFIVFSILYGYISYWPLMLTVAACHGVFWSGLLASCGALITDVIPLSRRTEGLAYWGMAPTIAVAIAPPVGLWLYGFGWPYVCWSMAGMSLCLLFLSSRIEGGRASSDGLRLLKRLKLTSLVDMSHLVNFRVVVHALTLYVISFGYGGITSYVAVMADERQLLPKSLFFTVLAVSILLTRVLVAPMGDRFGPRKLLYPSLLVVPPALSLLALSDSHNDIVASAVLFGIGIGGAFPSFITLVVNRTEPARRAATFGAILFAFDIGIGSGSVVTGRVIDQAGYEPAFMLAAAISVLAIPIFLGTSRLLPQEG